MPLYVPRPLILSGNTLMQQSSYRTHWRWQGGLLARSLAARSSELCKLGLLTCFYTIHAWNVYHERICGRNVGLEPALYPCPPHPAWRRLWYHALRPGHLCMEAFFRPEEPADYHDGISCVVFVTCGVLAILLGPATAVARRSCNWRFAWLAGSTVASKGFVVAYGLLYPTASLGAMVNTMLPRHAALMLWMSLAFPLEWRKQAVLAAVYASHMLCLIHLAATRGWPYEGSGNSPSAIVVRLVVSSALAVAVAAFGDWRRARAAAARAVSKATEAAGPSDPPSAPTAEAGRSDAAGAHLRNMPLREALYRGLAAARAPYAPRRARAAATAATVAMAPQATDAAASIIISSSRSSALDTASGGGSGGSSASSLRLRHRTAHTTAERSPLSSPVPVPSGDLAAGTAVAGAVERAATTAPAAGAVAVSPPAPTPLETAATAPLGAGSHPGRAAQQPRYRSSMRITRVYVKIDGVTPEQLDAPAVGDLAEDVAARGFVLTSVAVRSGCIEVVLELEGDRPCGCVGGDGGDGVGSENVCSGGGGVVEMELVRRMVSAFFDAVTPSVCEGSASGVAATEGAAGGGGGRGNGGSGVALRAHVQVGGARYIVSRDTGSDGGGDNDDGGGGSREVHRGWRIQVDPQQAASDLSYGIDGLDLGGSAEGSRRSSVDASPFTDPWVTSGVPNAPAPAFGTHDDLQMLLPAGVSEEPLIVLLPPCMVFPLGPSESATAAAEPADALPCFTLLVQPPRPHPPCLDGPAGTDTSEAATLASGPPEVLAWQRGCFIQVLSVNETYLPPPAVLGPEAAAPGCRAFSVTLSPIELAYGLVSFAIRWAPCTAIVAGGGGGGGGSAAGGRLLLTESPARVLLLPPALAAVAEELRDPLYDDLITALYQHDAEGVRSVTDFLADLSACLTHGSLEPQQCLHWTDPRVQTAAHGVGVHVCTLPSDASDRAHVSIVEVLAAATATPLAALPGAAAGNDSVAAPDCSNNTLPSSAVSSGPCTGAGSSQRSLPSVGRCDSAGSSTTDGGGSGGVYCVVPYERSGGPNATTGLLPLPAGPASDYSASTATVAGKHGSTADVYEGGGMGCFPLHGPNAAADVGNNSNNNNALGGEGGMCVWRPAAVEVAAVTASPAAPLATSDGESRLLSGGRLDLRDVMDGAVRLAKRTAGVSAEAGGTAAWPLRAVGSCGSLDERRRHLLEYTRLCGWRVTSGLLLGLSSEGDEGGGDDGGDGTRGGGDGMGGDAPCSFVTAQQRM